MVPIPSRGVWQPAPLCIFVGSGHNTQSALPFPAAKDDLSMTNDQIRLAVEILFGVLLLVLLAREEPGRRRIEKPEASPAPPKSRWSKAPEKPAPKPAPAKQPPKPSAARRSPCWPHCSAKPASSTSSWSRWILLRRPDWGRRPRRPSRFAKTIARFFALRAMVQQEEGSPIEVPPGFDAGRFRLTGNVAGDPPFHGRLVHHGWEAAEVQFRPGRARRNRHASLPRLRWN